MTMDHIPDWLKKLDTEDMAFLRHFILYSGSLKDMAKEYSVSYPTIRFRLDRLIQKISLEDKEEDSYVSLIKDLALEGELSFDVAKRLIKYYTLRKEEEK